VWCFETSNHTLPPGGQSAIVQAVTIPERTTPKLECPECRSEKAVIIKDQPWNRLAFCPECEHVWNHAQTRRNESAMNDV
jgi:ssDNA-binding Zn-finger/Zn-ribbon topoisomerase 1